MAGEGQAEFRPFQSSQWRWNEVFATRRPQKLDDDNTPYVRIASDAGAQDEPIRFFMKDPEEPDGCVSQAEKVEDFCRSATLVSLQSCNGNAGQRLMALLYDKAIEGEKVVDRGDRKALTARRLHQLLKRPQVYPRTISSTAGGCESAAEPPPQPLYGLPDPERRLIFITDPDCWSVLALISTASTKQAPALRDAIYSYLAFQPLISGAVTLDEFPTFQLSFSMPFYVWRRSKTALPDLIRTGDGRCIRRSKDLSYLAMRGPWSARPEIVDYLYEAQVSCALSGTDDSRWTAYLFVDTYFDDEEKRESVENYEFDGQGESILEDPLTAGKNDAGKPIWNSREYFLTVFKIRASRVKHEWRNVVHILSERIAGYTDGNPFPLSGTPISTKAAARTRAKQVRGAYDWTVQTRRLLTQIIQCLSSTIESWETFDSEKSRYFADMNECACLMLQSVRKTFSELRSLKKRLDSLKLLCDNFAKDLEIYLFLDGSEVAHLQQKTAEYSKVATVIMLLFAPVGLTAAMFSMPDESIFFTRNVISFFLFILGFGIVAWVIQMILLNYTRWRQVLALIRKGLWNEEPSKADMSLPTYNSYTNFG